jgi:hypothetical protein
MVSSCDLDVADDQAVLIRLVGNEKTTIQNQKTFDSCPVLLYKGSGTSIVLGNPEQGSDRFKGNNRRRPGLLPDWQYNH